MGCSYPGRFFPELKKYIPGMKNKGRRHKMNSMNCKGYLSYLTRPIESMSSEGQAGLFNSKKNSKRSAKFDKKKSGLRG